jgi:hypothetical protein
MKFTLKCQVVSPHRRKTYSISGERTENIEGRIEQLLNEHTINGEIECWLDDITYKHTIWVDKEGKYYEKIDDFEKAGLSINDVTKEKHEDTSIMPVKIKLGKADPFEELTYGIKEDRIKEKAWNKQLKKLEKISNKLSEGFSEETKKEYDEALDKLQRMPTG